jgi:hypothetical protein
MEQAHADQPPVVIDALDRVSVQLELGDDGGWEVNPAGMQVRKSDRLVTGLAQSLQQSLLLGVRARHDRIVASSGIGGASGVSEPRPLRLEVRRLGLGGAHRCAPPRSTSLLRDRDHWLVEVAAVDAQAQVAPIAWRARGAAGAPTTESHCRQSVMLV